MPKKTTSEQIEELARIVKIGFDATAKKVEVNERFDAVENRLDRIESKLTGHDNRLDNLEDDMRVVKTKVKVK